MKYSMLSAAILLCVAFTACKKDRTCECTNTVVSETSAQPGFTFTPQPSTTSSTTYKHVKKNNINVQACVSTESTNTFKSASYTGSTVVYYDVVQVSKKDCTIK